jgi:hypothetical protein
MPSSRRKKIKSHNFFNFLFEFLTVTPEVTRKWAACPPYFTVFFGFCEQPETEVKKIQGSRRKKIENHHFLNSV